MQRIKYIGKTFAFVDGRQLSPGQSKVVLEADRGYKKSPDFEVTDIEIENEGVPCPQPELETAPEPIILKREEIIEEEPEPEPEPAPERNPGEPMTAVEEYEEGKEISGIFEELEAIDNGDIEDEPEPVTEIDPEPEIDPEAQLIKDQEAARPPVYDDGRCEAIAASTGKRCKMEAVDDGRYCRKHRNARIKRGESV